MNIQELKSSKTVWAGVVAIVTAVGAYYTGQIDLGVMIQTVVTALIGIFLKDAVVSATK